MHEIIYINLSFFFVTEVLKVLQVTGRTPRTNFHAYPKCTSDEGKSTLLKIIYASGGNETFLGK